MRSAGELLKRNAENETLRLLEKSSIVGDRRIDWGSVNAITAPITAEALLVVASSATISSLLVVAY